MSVPLKGEIVANGPKLAAPLNETQMLMRVFRRVAPAMIHGQANYFILIHFSLMKHFNIIHDRKLHVPSWHAESATYTTFPPPDLHPSLDTKRCYKEIPVSTNQSIRKSCFSSRCWRRRRRRSGGERDYFTLSKIGVTGNALSGKGAYLIDFSEYRRIMDEPDCVSPYGNVFETE